MWAPPAPHHGCNHSTQAEEQLEQRTANEIACIGWRTSIELVRAARSGSPKILEKK